MSEQEQVGLLQPITSDGSSDASMCAIPLFRGANLLGRRHVAVPHACLSRRHLEAEVLDDGRGLKITVKGTNPAVVVSKSNRQRIDPNKSVILGSGEILELLPGKFPFRYVSSFSPSLSVAGQSRDFFFPETARTDREIRADSESFGDVRDRDDDERISKFGQSVERKELFRESNAVFSGGVEVDKRRVLGDTDWEEKSDMEDHRRQKRACLLQDKQKTNEVTIGEIKESGSRNEKEKEKEKTGMKKEITRSREMKPEITDVTEKHIETSIPLEEMFDLSRSSATFRLLRTQHVPWPANEGSVGINDVIQGDIVWAIISNYMVDIPWLLSVCPKLGRVPRVVLVHGEKGSSEEELKRQKPPSWVLHSPPLPLPYGTHHSKFFLLGFRTGIRVAIHSANLINIDWTNKTQGLWMQDFPWKSENGGVGEERGGREEYGKGEGKERGTKKDKEGLREDKSLSDNNSFEDDLVKYVEALNWFGCQVELPNEKGFRLNSNFLRKFDYSAAAVQLIGSVPGYHSGPTLMSWGHMRLRKVLSCYSHNARFKGAPLVCQFSSLGSLDANWLKEFQTSLSSGKTIDNSRLGDPSSSSSSSSSSGFRLIWPTVEDVRNSLEGYSAGGSICGPKKNVEKEFLTSHWSTWHAEEAGRQRAMPHIKTFVRYNGRQLAWMLLTSCNFSKAAWGALQKRETQLMVRSYELGVLFLPSLATKYLYSKKFSCTTQEFPLGKPLREEGKSDKKNCEKKRQNKDNNCDVALVALDWSKILKETSNSKEKREMDGNGRIVNMPLPYSLPPPSYKTQDIPWAWDCQYREPDVFGNYWPRSQNKHSGATIE